MEVAAHARTLEGNAYVLAANQVAEKYGISLRECLDMIEKEED
jgi:hypothetical protein